MIDFDIILEASEEKRGTKMWLECGNLSYCDINELILRLRQAEKDAARYKWLRDNSTSCQSFGGFMIDVDCCGEVSNPFAGIDRLIDGAMRCDK